MPCLWLKFWPFERVFHITQNTHGERNRDNLVLSVLIFLSSVHLSYNKILRKHLQLLQCQNLTDFLVSSCFSTKHFCTIYQNCLGMLWCMGSGQRFFCHFYQREQILWLPILFPWQYSPSKMRSKFFPLWVDLYWERSKEENGRVASPKSVPVHLQILGTMHNRDIFSIVFNMKVCCVFSLESPHWGDSNEYTQHTILNVKQKIAQNYPKYNNVSSNVYSLVMMMSFL